jgi:membrane protease YdiL (CAAX protease family)
MADATFFIIGLLMKLNRRISNKECPTPKVETRWTFCDSLFDILRFGSVSGGASKSPIVGLLLAAIAWLVMFSPWTAGRVNFWIAMPIATGVLATLALVANRRIMPQLLRFRPLWIPLGVAWSAGLYGLFFLGDRASKAILHFAGSEIADIYSRLPAGYDIPVALLLLLWIGPAEEIFWRGLVQQRLESRLGRYGALAAASLLYAAVHAWSMNLMLVLAALLCGLAWGTLFARWRSLWPCIISHAIWDVTIFVLCPIR